MENSADLGGCYPPQPSASVDNTLLDLQNSTYHAQPHSIIAKSQIETKQGNEIKRDCTLKSRDNGVVNFIYYNSEK